MSDPRITDLDGFRVEVDHGRQRGDIVLDRPPFNVIMMPQRDQLRRAFEALDEDDGVRVIVLRAVGEHFSSGGYIKGFLEASPEHVAKLAWNIAAPARCAKPVIAAARGFCFGVGFEISLACDFRLAADGAYQIGLPEAVLGILPGGGGTQRLPRLIGRGRALEVMLFGNVYHPREAERLGMVNRVLAPETLMSFAMGWARTLAKRPPRSIAAIKRAVYLGADRDLEAGLYIERTEMRDVMCTEDARTIMNAYNAAVRRDPMAARSDFLKGIGVPEAKGR